MKATRTFLLLALGFTSALPAPAADEPEVVYARFHRALAANNLEDMLRNAPEARRAEMARMSQAQKDASMKMISSMMPRAFLLRDKTVSADGKAARLVVSGPGEAADGGQTMYGTARMLVEKGEWKVSEVNWSPEAPPMLSPVAPGGAYAPRAGPKPAAAAPAAPAPARAAPLVGSTTNAPERKLGIAKQPCVFKPVMTAEDVENCK